MVSNELHPAAQRVAAAAKALGLSINIVTFSESTRTAAEAAAAIGCSVGQIVKSLVFTVRGEPVITLVSGDNQLDTRKLAGIFGVGRKQVERANADIVRGTTGFAIGGVPPFGYIASPLIYIDEDLTRYEIIWAAAGTPNTVFAIIPNELISVTKGTVADLKVDP